MVCRNGGHPLHACPRQKNAPFVNWVTDPKAPDGRMSTQAPLSVPSQRLPVPSRAMCHLCPGTWLIWGTTAKQIGQTPQTNAPGIRLTVAGRARWDLAGGLHPRQQPQTDQNRPTSFAKCGLPQLAQGFGAAVRCPEAIRRTPARPAGPHPACVIAVFRRIKGWGHLGP